MQWFTSVAGSSSTPEVPLHEACARRLLDTPPSPLSAYPRFSGSLISSAIAASNALGGHLVILADAKVNQRRIGMLGRAAFRLARLIFSNL